MSNNLDIAKDALDSVITKSRVHLYKPIQIAEILFSQRTNSDLNIDLMELETYRTRSKKWRDIVCMQFLGRVSTSSAKFQDNLFEDNAIPPVLLSSLGNENIENNGIVEAYIYKKFEEKHMQLENALNYCLQSTKENFELMGFLNQFWEQPGLKRSLDKIFEIVIYSLFEVITTAMKVKIDIYYDSEAKGILSEFSEFAEKVLNLNAENNRKTLDAHFHRVGVTNAADRGLDMYANFGSVVQIKHLSLDEDLAKDVVTSITSNKIIIVCKSVEENIINSLLTQIGWRSRIQAVITVDELISWYEKALTGTFSDELGEKIISTLSDEIKNEFPSVGNNDFQEFKNNRGYNNLNSEYWA
ncbi:MAG: HaeII family restriction endonuclease [Candidatus Marinimicrobia bacterium]|jgi:type II restriction enzyme|nr:HaeII family restriction endonuclease [Candidatus Neomarinimicrobiota bacterium]MBT7314303.1 HaeII family restriction endonuclease [Thiotrichales bacterium]MBT7556346.1 HaeII family restriction endonuclease [Candidatus Woesearchaeota archaeon]